MMNANKVSTMTQEELQASLARLGVRELEERMEVSPLLAASDVQAYDRCSCEGCCSTVNLPTPVIDVGLSDDISGVNHLGR